MTLTSAQQLDLLANTIRYIYGLFAYIPEKGGDHWKTPREFMVDLGGDCEDFAIFTYYLLVGLGFDKMKLRLAHVRTGLNMKQNHMILIVDVGGNDKYVLDNRLLAPIPLVDIGCDYLNSSKMRIIYSFNESGLWVQDRFFAGRYPKKWGIVLKQGQSCINQRL